MKKSRKTTSFNFLKTAWVDVRNFFTVGDWISLGIVSVVCVLLFVFIVFSVRYKAAQVEIVVSNERFLYSLNSSQSLTFYGPVGITNVKIADGMVDVVSSPGQRQICVNANPISKGGQWLVCLPNKVFIRIVGNSKNSSPDIISDVTQDNGHNKTLDGISF